MVQKRNEHDKQPHGTSSTHNDGDGRGFPDNGKKSRSEDLQDFAKIGGDILKRTVVTGLGVIKEVKEGLPKEATQILTKGKEELLRSLASKELLQELVAGGIDRVFAKVREHKLEISVRIAKADTENGSKKS